MALQTSMNRRSSLRSSSERRPGSAFQRWIGMEVVDGLLERVAPDEPHGVVGPAVAVGAQAIDRHDARVLQPAGDLGLEQEPLAADRVVGVLVEDLLEGHLAVQLGVERDEDGTQAALGVGPQDAEPLAVGGCRADRVAGGAVGVGRRRSSRSRADMGERRLDIGIAESARLSRVERPACTAARLFSASPPCFLRCRADQGLDRARSSASRSPRATRWSAIGRPLSRVHAWNAATSWPWSIRPFCKASSPKSRSRDGSTRSGMVNISRFRRHIVVLTFPPCKGGAREGGPGTSKCSIAHRAGGPGKSNCSIAHRGGEERAAIAVACAAGACVLPTSWRLSVPEITPPDPGVMKIADFWW